MANKKSVQIARQSVSDVPENIDLNEPILVRNGYHGILVYVSPRTKEEFIWSEFGDVQEMELKELRNVKNTHKSFFENNYFLFDDEYSWVIKYLGVSKYYEHAISVDGYDELFNKTPDEIKIVIGEMSEGQKKSLLYCAQEKIASGEIDSIRVIRALEDGLGVHLIE